MQSLCIVLLLTLWQSLPILSVNLPVMPVPVWTHNPVWHQSPPPQFSAPVDAETHGPPDNKDNWETINQIFLWFILLWIQKCLCSNQNAGNTTMFYGAYLNNSEKKMNKICITKRFWHTFKYIATTIIKEQDCIYLFIYSY